jgi:hypothetical protein
MNGKQALPIVGMAAILTLPGLAPPTKSPSSGGVSEVRRAIEAGNSTWERAFRTLDAAAIAR